MTTKVTMHKAHISVDIIKYTPMLSLSLSLSLCPSLLCQKWRRVSEELAKSERGKAWRRKRKFARLYLS